MSRITKLATTVRTAKKHNSVKVSNHMGGESYEVDPLTTLKFVTASSIFAEPKFYEDKKTVSVHSKYDCGFYGNLYADTSSTMMERSIDNALDYDFLGTLKFADELRNVYNMRLNSAVIIIRASIHPDREIYTRMYENLFSEIVNDVAKRPDDLSNQLDYITSLGNTIPNIIKRAWAKKLKTYNRYQLHKYKSKGLIDLVRLSHANSEVINELMKTGTIHVDDSETTWETLKSRGLSWMEIIERINLPHMALLRNLRGILIEFSNMQSEDVKDRLIDILMNLRIGVQGGRQFPYRYYSAYKAVQEDLNIIIDYKELAVSALDDCLLLSIDNMPKIKGHTICLSDNSGSAWGTIPSEFGTMTVAEINNLSSILTVMSSDSGEIGLFGDHLIMYNVQFRNQKFSILDTLQKLNKVGKHDVGQSTENGIWLFFDRSLREKELYDNIFIYSDQQAGRGGLYGKNADEYRNFSTDRKYIDVFKLMIEYRKTVKKDVNVFSVQTAGYDNSILPDCDYRVALLTGWTGKESLFASRYIELWDKVEKR